MIHIPYLAHRIAQRKRGSSFPARAGSLVLDNAWLTDNTTSDYAEAESLADDFMDAAVELYVTFGWRDDTTATAQRALVEKTQVNGRRFSIRTQNGNFRIQGGTANGSLNCNFDTPAGSLIGTPISRKVWVTVMFDLSQATEFHALVDNLGTPAKIRVWIDRREVVLTKANANLLGTSFDSGSNTDPLRIGAGASGSSSSAGWMTSLKIWVDDNPTEAQIDDMWTENKGPFLVSSITDLADPTLGWRLDGDLVAEFGGADFVFQGPGSAVFESDRLVEPYKRHNYLGYETRHWIMQGFEASSDYYTAFPGICGPMSNAELLSSYKRGAGHTGTDDTDYYVRSSDARTNWPVLGDGSAGDERGHVNQTVGDGNRGAANLVTSTGRVIHISVHANQSPNPARTAECQTSDDDGDTFTARADLPIPTEATEFFAIGAAPVEVDGELLWMGYCKQLLVGGYFLVLFRSTNDGTTWSILDQAAIDGRGPGDELEEPSIKVLADGSLRCYYRVDGDQTIRCRDSAAAYSAGVAPTWGSETTALDGWSWTGGIKRDPVSGRWLAVIRRQGTTDVATADWHWSDDGLSWNLGGSHQRPESEGVDLFVYADIIFHPGDDCFYVASAFERFDSARTEYCVDKWDMDVFRSANPTLAAVA